MGAWLEEAEALPLRFAMVREDPLLDAEVLRALDRPASVLMVASGGCTAALLACLPEVTALHLVDPNPAQLALSRLKLRLLSLPPRRRAELLGHASLAPEQRARDLAEQLAPLELSLSDLGPPALVAQWGPDHAGRYERLFARLRAVLQPVRRELDALLSMADPARQAQLSAPGTALGDALDDAFEEVFALPHLVRLFGEGATRYPWLPFPAYFAQRTRHVLAQRPADAEPWLWSLLDGRLPESAPVPWLAQPPRTQLPALSFACSPMEAALRELPPASFDLVHLSNILDWLSEPEARATLAAARRALRPGGYVFVRQLNSTLDIASCGGSLRWHDSEALLARDRSFFYRALHLASAP